MEGEAVGLGAGGGGVVAAAGRGGGEEGVKNLKESLGGWSSVVDVPVILQHFQQFFDAKVPQIQFIDSLLACSCAAEAGTHSANCAEDRGDSAGAVRNGAC